MEIEISLQALKDPLSMLIISVYANHVKNNLADMLKLFRGMDMVSLIKKMCKEKKISLNELESAVGLGVNTIYKWDKASPSSDKLQKVADYFDVSVDYLLGRKEKPIQMDGRTQEAVDLFLALTDDQKSALMDFLKSLASSK